MGARTPVKNNAALTPTIRPIKILNPNESLFLLKKPSFLGGDNRLRSTCK
ncbi:Uncharacterised protein [Legionella pneumophila]|nr:Uncharacterised protein [Legionella pneumophila]